jgi:hypothetical protein
VLRKINARVLEPTLVVVDTSEAATAHHTRTRRSRAARTTLAGGDHRRRGEREIEIAFGG